MLHRHYKIVSTPRFIVFLVICILTSIILFNLFTGMYQAQSLSNVQYKSVMVESGDTLWSIASECCDNDQNVDVRTVVRDICRINDISAADLQAGDVILVPQGV